MWRTGVIHGRPPAMLKAVFVDFTLVRQVERTAADDAAALAGALATLEPGSGTTAVPLAGGQVVLLGSGMFVNRGIGMGLETPMRSKDLTCLERLSERVGVPAEVEVCPWADPSILRLASLRGFQPAWFRSTLIRRIERGETATSTHAVIVEQVDDDAGLATWQQIAASAFGYSTATQRRASDLYASAAFRLRGERLYVASIGDLLVGVAALTVNGGLATLGGMATVPSARRRGVQGALIRYRLGVAADLGCHLAVSTAAPGGDSERNLLRNGFSVLYSKLALRRPITE
jgi:GNAT superfamily N-acetyltransferase